MTIRTIRELDALPDGTEIELLDRRGTRRLKVGGHWRWPDVKDPESTWNVNTYVNVRRWGVRIIERNREVSSNPIEEMELVLRQAFSHKLAEVIERYSGAYEKREAGIGAFLDDEGELKEGETYERYDSHCYDAWSDSHGDLGSLLAELAPFLK